MKFRITNSFLKSSTIILLIAILQINSLKSQVSNDNCIGAITLPISSVATNGTSINATQSLPGCIPTNGGAEGNANDDVWYKFVATGSSTQITLNCNTGFDGVLEAFSNCSTSLGKCIDINADGASETTTITTVTGQTYYLRIYDYGAGVGGTFSIKVENLSVSIPSNNDCTTATSLTVNATAISGTTVNATQSFPACTPSPGTAGNANDDVWYKFTASGTNTKVTLNCNAGFDGVLEAFSNCSTSLGTCIDVNAGGASETTTITTVTGQTYYLRIYDYGTGVGGTFSIKVEDLSVSIPSNNECTNAISLTVNATAISGTTVNATQSLPACTPSPGTAGTANDDVWYKFTATSSYSKITLTSGSNFDGVLELFSNCTTSLGKCIDSTLNGDIESAKLVTTIGQTYYIRVYNFDAFNGSTFTINVENINTAPPTNDNCANAINLNMDANPISGTSVFATQSLISCNPTGNANDDVWYKFTATATNSKISVISNSNYDAVIEAFSNCSTSLGQCVDNTTDGITETVNISTIPNQVYYFRTYDFKSTIGGDFSVKVEGNSIPNNDNCTGAINLNVGATAISGTTLYATQSFPACISAKGLTGIANDDVWYKFTATSTSTLVTVNSGTNFDAVIEAYSNCTTSLGQCEDATNTNQSENLLINTVVGQTYFFRVFGFDISNGGTFSVGVSNVVVPVNDNCNNALTIVVDGSSVSGTSKFGTQSFPACTSNNKVNYANDDVWYKFIAISNKTEIELNSIADFDGVFEIYSNCSTSLSNQCIDLITNQGTEKTIINSIIGQTYYLRVYDAQNGLGGDFSIKINSNNTTSPQNDECINATEIIVSSTTPFLGTSVNATQSELGCSTNNISGNANDDVWYKFTAKSEATSITVNSDIGFDAVIQPYTNCGTPINNCTNVTTGNQVEFTKLNTSTGKTYYFRVYDFNSTNGGTFNILVDSVSLPQNDECANAIELTISNPPLNTTSLNATQSKTDCFGTINNDVWYKFTAQNKTTKLTIAPKQSTSNMIFSVYENCDSIAFIECYNKTKNGQPETLFLNTIVGKTYWIGVSDSSKIFGSDFSVDLENYINPLDSCKNAQNITVGNQVITNGSFLGSTPTYSCNNILNNDIWYSFNATSKNTNILLTPNATLDAGLQVYEGCTPLPATNCYNKSGQGQLENLNVETKIGNTYYIRAFVLNNPTNQSFALNVKETPDTCTAPKNISLGCNTVNSQTITWDESNNSNWEIIIQPIISPAPTTSGLLVSTNSFSITGLAPNSVYEVYLRSVCSSTSFSKWSQPFTFKTPIADVPSANPFCGESGAIVFANSSGSDNVGMGSIACLKTTPYPIYYYLKVSESGKLIFEISQWTQFDSLGKGIGDSLDVDFVAWGPFSNLENACGSLENGCPNPNDCVDNTKNRYFYPYNSIIDCSFDPAPKETLTIPYAKAGEIYPVLITNFRQAPGFIKLRQKNIGELGAGKTNCNFLCETSLGPDKNICGDTTTNLTASYLGVATNIKWYQNGVLQNTKTNTFKAKQSGEYIIEMQKPNCANTIKDTIQVKFVPDFTIQQVDSLIACGDTSSASSVYNLDQVKSSILEGLDSNIFTVKFFLNTINLENDIDPIVDTKKFTSIFNPQTIHIRVHRKNEPNCYKSNTLILKEKTKPIISALNNITICSGSNVSLAFNSMPSNSNYSWKTFLNNQYLNDTTKLFNIKSINSSTTDDTTTLAVVSKYKTCSSDTMKISIITLPNPTMLPPVTTALCTNEKSTIRFDSEYDSVTYNWTNNNTKIGLFTTGTGALNFVALNADSIVQVAKISITPTRKGCYGTKDSLLIKVKPSKDTNIYISACYNFVWNNNTYFKSGNYISKLTDQLGCDSIVNLHLTILSKDFPNWSVPEDTTICTGESLVLNQKPQHNYIFNWNKITNNTTFNPTKKDTLILKATEISSGCQQYHSTKIKIDNCLDVYNPCANIDVFPNPGNGLISISHKYPDSLELNIFDITGKLVNTYSIEQNKSKLDLTYLTTGTYLVSFKHENTMLCVKKIEIFKYLDK